MKRLAIALFVVLLAVSAHAQGSLAYHGHPDFPQIPAVSLVEDYTGTCVFARITTNGYTVRGNRRGAIIDGVEYGNDSQPVLPDRSNAFIQQELESWAKALEFLKAIDAAGDDAVRAWEWAIDHIHANPSVVWADFLSAFQAEKFFIYSGMFIEAIEDVFGLTGFPAVRDGILSQPPDRLKGRLTDIVWEVRND